MFNVYCFNIVATIDEPMPGAVGVEFVNKTPSIIGRDVLVEFMTMGTTDTVRCELGDYAVVEDCKCMQHTQTYDTAQHRPVSNEVTACEQDDLGEFYTFL